MPDADELPQRYELQLAPLRRGVRALRVAVAWYLSGAVILTALAAWSASRPADAAAAALIALSAAQVDYFAYAAVARLWLVSRDLRRVGTPAGQLALDSEGVRIGHEVIDWRQVEKVRARRRGVPSHIELTVRRPEGRRRKRRIYNRYYDVYLDELAAAFGRKAPVAGAGQPRRPARDEATGTITFFFNDWVLRPLRYYHLWSLWEIPLMFGPAGAGLFIMHQSLAATFVLAAGCGFALLECAKVAVTSRLLRVSRRGLGRLVLTPDYLKLPGTDVPVPWSHVQGATVVRGQRPGLAGVVACPDPDPASDCKLRGRRSPFHIAESLYYTTADDIGGAFARYTDVDRSETRP